MKRMWLFCYTALVSVTLATTSMAQCVFDAPLKAKTIKAALVRAYAECTSPDTNYAGVDACSAPSALSPFEFGPSGSCSAKIAVTLETDCPSGAPVPCQDLTVKVTCKNIMQAGGVLPVDGGPEWALKATARTTLADPLSSDMTTVDEAAVFLSLAPVNGTIRWKYKRSENCFPFCSLMAPGCTSVELSDVVIADPNGDTFAILGLSTR